MTSETDKIKERYERRKKNLPMEEQHRSKNYIYNNFVRIERESAYSEAIKTNFSDLGALKLLEIGAGTGDNLFLFNEIGINPKNTYANELLADRLVTLGERYPDVNIIEGDATLIDSSEHTFDIIFQGTVFTSILDESFKEKLAAKMWSLLNPGGLFLWYDFAFDNPRNKDVKGVKRREIKKLFPQAENVVFKRITLAPPIGRKISKLYPLFNAFPFLRTHLVAEIRKK